jgi:hypothetical protein
VITHIDIANSPYSAHHRGAECHRTQGCTSRAATISALHDSRVLVDASIFIISNDRHRLVAKKIHDRSADFESFRFNLMSTRVEHGRD